MVPFADFYSRYVWRVKFTAAPKTRLGEHIPPKKIGTVWELANLPFWQEQTIYKYA